MKSENLSKNDDPYRVEATSANDLDGSAATELTGMIPFLPETPAEIEAYKSLMPYSPESIVQKSSDPAAETPEKETKISDSPSWKNSREF